MKLSLQKKHVHVTVQTVRNVMFAWEIYGLCVGTNAECVCQD
jgi:hypothetical protein